jgi:hypothetical protein
MLISRKTIDDWIYNRIPAHDKEVTENEFKRIQVSTANKLLKMARSEAFKDILLPEIQKRIDRYTKGCLRPDAENVDESHYMREEYAHKTQALEEILHWLVKQFDEAENTKKEWEKNDKGSSEKSPSSEARSS